MPERPSPYVVTYLGAEIWCQTPEAVIELVRQMPMPERTNTNMAEIRHCDREGCPSTERVEENAFLTMSGLYRYPTPTLLRFCSWDCLSAQATDYAASERQRVERLAAAERERQERLRQARHEFDDAIRNDRAAVRSGEDDGSTH